VIGATSVSEKTRASTPIRRARVLSGDQQDGGDQGEEPTATVARVISVKIAGLVSVYSVVPFFTTMLVAHRPAA